MQIGKYEFYPYEFDNDKTATLEDLEKLLKKVRVGKQKSLRKKRDRSQRVNRIAVRHTFNMIRADETEIAGKWIEVGGK